MMTLDVTQWISPLEAARRLHVSPQWVRRLVDMGKLQACRTSLGHLIDPSSVELLRKEREAQHDQAVRL